MSHYFKPKDNIVTILLYAVSLTIIANSACMWEYTITSPLYEAPLGIVIIVLCFIHIVWNGILSTEQNTIIRLAVIILFLSTYEFFSDSKTGPFVVTYIGLIIVFYIYVNSLYSNNQLKRFFKSYSDIILIIAVVSLIFWGAGSVMGIIPGKNELYFWAEKIQTTYSWYGLYYENPVQNIGHPIARNLGIFTESPAYSGQLLYALLIDYGILATSTEEKKRKYIYRIAVYIITLCTTLSTKGLIGVMIFLFLVFGLRKSKTKAGLSFKICTGVLLLMTVAVASYWLVLQKLGTGSGSLRMDDIYATIQAWKKNTLFGVGYGNGEEILKYSQIVRNSSGLSMGINVLLATGGLWLSAFYIAGLLRSRKMAVFRDNPRVWIVTAAIIVFNLFISNCGFSDPYIFMIAAAYSMPVKQGYDIQGSLAGKNKRLQRANYMN